MHSVNKNTTNAASEPMSSEEHTMEPTIKTRSRQKVILAPQEVKLITLK